MESPKQIIDRIRRRWGVGLTSVVDPEVRETLEHQKQQLGNMLELLSDQLYQSELHFFLELLQNADDNEYAESVIPSLEIAIDAQRIVFRNNERGFTDANVRALCGVGNSTKAGRKKTKIGEKGVGFKAVFQVSDQPEIHSGGYHFRFDKTVHAQLGLVVPEWIEAHEFTESEPSTTIVLPLRQDHALRLDVLGQLQPELLLFLRHLRRLRVHDRRTGDDVTLMRRDSGKCVTVTRKSTQSGKPSHSVHQFFVHRHVVSMDGITEKLRPDFTETEVVVALPTRDDGSADERSPRAIYAFLPIVDSGFRFVCHADFVLSTSRETILKERPWNCRLRDELGAAFANAMVASERGDELGRSCLRFLAPPGTITDTFLRPIMAKAIEHVRMLECVPSENGGFATPVASLQHDSGGLSTLVNDEALKSLLNRRYVDEEIEGLSRALDLLNVETFAIKHLILCLQKKVWVDAQPVDWFGDLYGLLGVAHISDSDLSALKKSPVLRLADGRVVTATTKSVYRSLAKRTGYGFEDELLIIDPKVLAAVGKSNVEGARQLFRRWGINDAAVVTIIDDHILRLHASSDWNNRTAVALRGHVRYVRDHLKEYLNGRGDAPKQSAALNVLATTLYLQNSKNTDGKGWFARADNLYLGARYSDPLRVEKLFGAGIKEQLVAQAYMEDDRREDQKDSRKAWSEFFIRLGVNTKPRVVKDGTDWHPSPELESVINDDNWAQKEHLLQILDKEWERHYSQFQHTAYGGVSQFVSALQSMVVKARFGEAHPLSECYLFNEDNKAVFGLSVPYVEGDWDSDSFLEAVGVVTGPSVSQVLDRLAELGNEDLPEKSVAGAVKRLYQFLDTHFEGHEEEIREAFKQRQIVYLRIPDKGGWSTIWDCCWRVPVDVREFAPVRGLSSVWQDLREFFCDKLELWDEMTPDEWVEALEKIADANLEVDRARSLAQMAYRALASATRDGDEEDDWKNSEWLQKLRDGNLLWTSKGEWWHNHDDVIAPDDQRLEPLFENRDAIAFLDVPRESLPPMQELLEALGIPRLSNAVDVAPPNPRNSRADEWLGERIAKRWRFVARYLFHKQFKAYERAVDGGQLSALRTIKAFAQDPLVLKVNLRGEEAQAPFPAWAEVRPRGVRLWVDRKHSRNWDRLALEIGRILGVEDTEAINLGRLLGADTHADVEAFLALLKIADLSEEERRRWGESGADDGTESEAEIDDLHDESEEEVRVETSARVSSGRRRHFDDDADDTGVDTGASTHVDPVGDDQVVTTEADESVKSHITSDSDETYASPKSAMDDDAVEAGDVASDVDSSSDPARDVGESTEPTGLRHTRTREHRSHDRREATVERGTHVDRARPGRPPTNPDEEGQSTPRSERGRGRLITYVGAGQARDGDDWDREQRPPTRGEVAAAAVESACEAERREGRIPEEKPHNHPGYDVESRNAGGEIERYIEVKGIDGQWDECGVVLSHTQFGIAEKLGNKFWLYVVEFARDTGRRRLHRFQNVFKKVKSYGFDYGWKAVADETFSAAKAVAAALKVGSRMRLPDGRIGTIVAITPVGALSSVSVRLDNGSTTNLTRPYCDLVAALVLETKNGPTAP